MPEDDYLYRAALAEIERWKHIAERREAARKALVAEVEQFKQHHADDCAAMGEAADKVRADLEDALRQIIDLKNDIFVTCPACGEEYHAHTMTDAENRYVAGLKAERERLRAAYVPQVVATKILDMLTGAGMGKPGKPNTIWAMTKEALTEMSRLQNEAGLEADLPKYGDRYRHTVDDKSAVVTVSRVSIALVHFTDHTHMKLSDIGCMEKVEPDND